MSNYVCDELIDNIFKRLPLKSLLRFRCLSKSRCSHIGSSDFIRAHVRQNPQKLLILHAIDSKKLCTEDFYTIHSEDQLPLTPKHGYMGIGKFPSNDCSIVGSCNGLVCLFNHESRTITLWNPSIRRKLTLPDPPMRNYSPQEYGNLGIHVAFGFGFNTVTNDYKIVRIFYSICERAPSISTVYTTNTGTWRTIASPLTRRSYVMSSGCFVNGALHWIVKERDCYVMSFDLSTQVFGRVVLPEPSVFVRELIVVNSSLAVITGDLLSYNNLRIWVMKEDDDVASWSMFYKLESLPSEGGIHKVLLLTTNGDFVFLTYREGYKVYNTATGIRSGLLNFNAHSKQCKIERYVESLVLLNKETFCNGPKKRKQKKKTSG